MEVFEVMENNDNINEQTQTVYEGNPADVEIVGNAVLYSILAYIGILWIIGLVVEPEKNTAFVKNHVNNGLVLFIANIVMGIILAIPFLGWIVGGIGYVAILVFAIMGIVAACKKKFFTIPLIGNKFQIIK